MERERERHPDDHGEKLRSGHDRERRRRRRSDDRERDGSAAASVHYRGRRGRGLETAQEKPSRVLGAGLWSLLKPPAP